MSNTENENHASPAVLSRVSLVIEMFLAIQRARDGDKFDGERFDRRVFTRLALVEQNAVPLVLRNLVTQGILCERRRTFSVTSKGEDSLARWYS